MKTSKNTTKSDLHVVATTSHYNLEIVKLRLQDN
jgi:hypothetical protein